MNMTQCITLEEELKKNPELKLQDIQILRDWCEKQPHLPKIQDVELAIFLHSNYYHIEPTKSKIENYYTYRTHAPELFSNRDITKVKRLRDAFKVTAFFPLECLTQKGYNIMMVRLVDVDPSHFFHNEALNALIMLYDEFVWTRGSMPGIIYVFDAMNISMGHAGRFNFASLKKFMYFIQDAAPIRLKKMHILNTSSIIETLINMLKPFMKKDMMESVQLHTSLQSLNEYVSVELLPNELGGKAGATKELMDAHFKRIENFREWFLEDEKNNRVNESLRIGKAKTSGDLFGVDGSFKKIEFD